MCFASSHVGNALPVLSTVFAFSMSTLVCAQNSLPTWDTSACAYLPSKQASASLCNFSSRCARRRLRTIVFEKGSKARGEVREFEERTSACLASYQTSVWCVAVGACEMCWCVAYARCGWKMWLNV